MQLIVAVDKEWGIGKNNDLLYHIPLDLQYFKAKTLGKIIVMGGNTLLSFPRSQPLPNRTNIVLTDVFTRDDCIVVPTLDKLFLELKKYPDEDIFIVGGAMFYKTMLPYCTSALITKIDDVGGATHFLPNLDQDHNWHLERILEEKEEDGLKFAFTQYSNSFPLKY